MPIKTASIEIQSKGLTDVGRVRQANQDAFLIDDKEKIYIVADGMGGHAGGEIASSLCIEQIARQLRSQTNIFSPYSHHPNGQIIHSMITSVNFASTKIYERALEEPSLKGMGTTATVGKLVGKFFYIAHVGDSRCYLVRCNLIYQLTSDHSLVYEQVKAGLITQEESEIHHLRNVITRSVGYQEEEDVDTIVTELEADDYLVLCSDGLHGKVTDREISTTIAKFGLDAVHELLKMANDRGGEDNITIIVLKVVCSN
jgi:serine/threonine protein phosphatase PrpC